MSVKGNKRQFNRETLFNNWKSNINNTCTKMYDKLPNGSVTDETGNRSMGTCVFTFKLDLHTYISSYWACIIMVHIEISLTDTHIRQITMVKPYRFTAVDFQTGSAAPAPRIHSSVTLSRRTNSSLSIKNNQKIIHYQELVLPSPYHISYVHIPSLITHHQ